MNTQTKSVFGAMALAAVTLFAVMALTSSANANSTVATRVYMPIVTNPSKGIYGTLTLNGKPAANVTINLRYTVDWNDENPINTTSIFTVTTDANGSYNFLNAPSIKSPERLWALYFNYENDPKKVYFWIGQRIMTYTAGQEVMIPTMDLADIALVSPADGTTTELPATFKWVPRTGEPTHSYEWNIYDLDGPGYYVTKLPVGADSFILYKQNLTSDFKSNTTLYWDIAAFINGGSVDNGNLVGSFESRTVKFTNAYSVLTFGEAASPEMRAQMASRFKQ